MGQSLTDHVTTQLRIELARRNMTTAQLAAKLGVSDMWVSRRLRGKTPIHLADLERLARAFDIPVTSFFAKSDQPAGVQ